MTDLNNISKIKQILEVALLTSANPLSLDDLQKLFPEKIERSTLRMLLDELKTEWQERTMELVLVASGYRFKAKDGLLAKMSEKSAGLHALQYNHVLL